MATERISFLARADDDDCKLGDSVSLWFGDGDDAADNNTGDVSLTFDGTNLAIAGGPVKLTDVDMVLGTSTGTKIGTATTQKLGFYNATPIVQPSAYTQTYSTADKTHADLTSATLTDSSAGTPATTITALSDGSTYANVVASLRNNLASLAAQNNALRVDLVDAKGVINSIIDDLQALGLVG